MRLQQAGHDAIFGSAESFVGFLPFHADSREPGKESAAFQAARWITLKVARELGINVTGGSASVADAWQPLRLAAATARARLLGVASLRWKLPVAELEVRDGVVSHPSGPRAHYGELVAQAALAPPGDVTLEAAQRDARHRQARAAHRPGRQVRRARRVRPRRAAAGSACTPASCTRR